ncbi:hypothetical protein TEA_008263 [Camellia sinensis var. sinensis]|uniref:SSD domain-containing protein n=1 Tax=Camellia sinensis var. sinensis TaxID=542762 RepID=A0A4S4DDE0_CAMSN|nr:hypothetical protein TEA_008263 [Camellia sinensis var. sinensis]
MRLDTFVDENKVVEVYVGSLGMDDIHYTTADTCLSAFKAPLDPSTALGGFSGNNYSEASAFIITYPVNNAIDKEGNESKRAVAWEKAFIQLVKVLLGLSGVMLVMLSVLGSVGIFSAFGIKSTLIIMEVIPFLVLAVGVDNMCILVHAVKRQPLELPLEGRISNALVEVGPSITLASLSEVLAFAVGSFIPMPACRVFSMFAGLSVDFHNRIILQHWQFSWTSFCKLLLLLP